MATIPLTEMCAVCYNQGKEARLQLDLDRNVSFCPNGHEFAYESAPGEAVKSEKLPVVVDPAIEEAIKSEGPPPALEVPPEAHREAPAGAQDSGSGHEPVQTAIAAEAAPKPPPARPGTGGVSFLTVGLPDWAFSGLQAEAETQGVTVEEYFRERVEFGINNGWFFAVGPTRR